MSVRNCKVTIQHPTNLRDAWFSALGNQIDIVDLRVQFKVEKTLHKDPNSCSIVITNLNKSSRTEFQTKPLIVTLYGGYDGEYRHIYTGDLRYGASTLKTPDWETTLQLGSGDRAFRLARVNRSYTAGTSVYTVISDAAKTMGLAAPTRAQLGIGTEQFNSGVSLEGYTRDELTRLLAPYGYHWSIQDDHLVVLTDDKATPGLADIVSQQSGMIGSPEISAPQRPGTKKGDSPTVKCKMSLRPELIPGKQIQVVSKNINNGKGATFKLTKVVHTGDTHGDPWQTEVEAKPV